MQTTPSFLEIGSRQAGPTQQFFSTLFGWPFTPMEGGGVYFDASGQKIGLHGDDPTPQIVAYFRVPDLNQAVAQVLALGGSAETPTVEEPGFGRFCNCRDPQGLAFGLHQVLTE